MATILTQRRSFPPGNRWGISDGTDDMEFSLPRLIHAAVTAGHNQGWRQSIASDVGAQFELLWKSSALQATVCEGNSFRGRSASAARRLVPTDRFGRMDPSERRALTYHLGITMAVAWARKALRVPWLLHLDVYQQQLNINLQPGNSRPDLVGLHADGSWVVFEAKGRSSAPGATAEAKAKRQSQRILNIGGKLPTSCFAFFSYFGVDRRAVGRRKPQVLHVRVIDPPTGSNDEPINLPLFTKEKFLELYYQPWFSLVSKTDWTARQEPIIWRHLPDLDFRIGLLADVAMALERRRFAEVPQIVREVAGKEGLANQFLDWAGDGLVFEPGESWHKLLDQE